MAVEVIDTLKPKNNGTFPVVEAEDVEVSEGVRLPEALGQKAEQTDLEELSSALEEKADTSDISNLQSQIDQIAQTAGTGTADTEIGQARVDYKGASFTTLKERIDSSDQNFSNAFSAEYDDAEAYSEGQVVIKNGILYKAKINIPAGETWTAGHWTTTTISAEIEANLLLLCKRYDTTTSYSPGQYVIHDNKLYKCRIQTAAGGENWTAGHWTYINTDAVNSLATDLLSINDEIVDVQADIVDIQSDIYHLKGKFDADKFVNGDISGGNIISRTYTVVNSDTFTFSVDSVVTANEGFNVIVWFYPQGDTPYSKAYNGVVVPANLPIRIVIARSTVNTSETANITEFVNAVSYSASEFNHDYINSKSWGLKKDKYHNIEYSDLLLDSSGLDKRNSLEISYDYNIRFQDMPFSIRQKTNSNETSSAFRLSVNTPFTLLGCQEIDIYVYISDYTKITSIRLSTIESSMVKSITDIKNGWNKLRFYTEGAGNWDESASTSKIEIRVYTTTELNLWIGDIVVVKPAYANVILIDDGPYYSFFADAYPTLKENNIPVTWAIDATLLDDESETTRKLIKKSELDVLALDGMSEFSFHSYDGTIMSSATANQALSDTLNSIRFLKKNGIEPTKIWRAAWLQNSCAHPELANLELDASASYSGQASVCQYPFPDKFDIPRVSLHGKTTAQIDGLFEKLRKEHATVLLYTHGISEGSSAELSPSMFEYFVDKMTDGISAQYINATTYNRLINFYFEE